MADFSHIKSIQTINDESRKPTLQLKVAGQSELLSITCPSLIVAENMADLIDGYCRIINNSKTSIWNRKDGQPPKYNKRSNTPSSESSSSSPAKTASVITSTGIQLGNLLICSEDYAEIVDEEGDYSSPARDYEIDRLKVELQNVIGEGQFGDVHKGIYKPSPGVETIQIAVKTCKIDGDTSMAEKFLEEACNIYNTPLIILIKLSNFDCFRYNATIRSPTYNKISWDMFNFSDLDRNGIGASRRITSLFTK